jgi:hypothetical protein
LSVFYPARQVKKTLIEYFRTGSKYCFVEVGMLDLKLLGSIRYVVDDKGKKAAVQLDLKTWNALLGYLEDLEDRSLVKEKLHRLFSGPEKSGAVAWDAAGKEW